jgi:hypothetical protein
LSFGIPRCAILRQNPSRHKIRFVTIRSVTNVR